MRKSEEKWFFEFGNPTDLNPSVLALEISLVKISDFQIFTHPKKPPFPFQNLSWSPSKLGFLKNLLCRLIVISLVASQRNSAILQPFFSSLSQPGMVRSASSNKKHCWTIVPLLLERLENGGCGFSFGQATKITVKPEDLQEKIWASWRAKSARVCMEVGN